jgi:hypothetical protein
LVSKKDVKKCKNLRAAGKCKCFAAARSRTGVCPGGGKCLENAFVFLAGSGTDILCETASGGVGSFKYTKLKGIVLLQGFEVFLVDARVGTGNLDRVAEVVGASPCSAEWICAFGNKPPQDGDVVVVNKVRVMIFFSFLAFLFLSNFPS